MACSLRYGTHEGSRPHLVNHVAFRVPVLVHVVAIDLYELLEYGGLAAGTFHGKAGRVVEVAVDSAGVFVVRVLGAKYGGTDGARKMFDVKLHVCGRGREPGTLEEGFRLLSDCASRRIRPALATAYLEQLCSSHAAQHRTVHRSSSAA